MTIGWPMASGARAMNVRDVRSLAPPGPKGMTRLMGLAGNSWADAGAGAAAALAATSAARASPIVFAPLMVTPPRLLRAFPIAELFRTEEQDSAGRLLHISRADSLSNRSSDNGGGEAPPPFPPRFALRATTGARHRVEE